jgi:hypothetical protein
MSTQDWNRLHIDNLHNLVALREAILRDPVAARYEYGIDKSTATRYANASDQDLHALAFAVDHSLFIPRYVGVDLCALLSKPVEIRGLCATVNHIQSRHQLSGEERDDVDTHRPATE